MCSLTKIKNLISDNQNDGNKNVMNLHHDDVQNNHAILQDTHVRRKYTKSKDDHVILKNKCVKPNNEILIQAKIFKLVVLNIF